jgi:acyl carrier protein
VIERIWAAVSLVAKFVEPGEVSDADRPLIDLGVDSFALVDLLARIEEEFAIAIPDELLVAETFHSAGSLADAVLSLCAVENRSSVVLPDA